VNRKQRSRGVIASTQIPQPSASYPNRHNATLYPSSHNFYAVLSLLRGNTPFLLAAVAANAKSRQWVRRSPMSTSNRPYHHMHTPEAHS